MTNPARGIVFDIRRFSIHDGPGIRTTVFLKGCPLSCAWCHNPEGQSSTPERILRLERCLRCGACAAACSHDAIRWDGVDYLTDDSICVLCAECVAACASEARQIAGQEMDVDQVLAAIERDTPFYDESHGGVTFSGGEPLAQPGFLQALLHTCRRRELHTAVDTSGLATWEVFDNLRTWVNLFLYDLKLIDDQAHRAYTGVSNRLILANLRALSEHSHDICIRIPVIPGITDNEENIRGIGAFLSSLPNRHPVELLPYHPTAQAKYERLARPYDLKGTSSPSGGHLATLAQILLEYDLTVVFDPPGA